MVAITIERFSMLRQCNKVSIITLPPHFTPVMQQTICSAKFLIFFIILLSISFNLVKFFELTVNIKVSITTFCLFNICNNLPFFFSMAHSPLLSEPFKYSDVSVRLSIYLCVYLTTSESESN